MVVGPLGRGGLGAIPTRGEGGEERAEGRRGENDGRAGRKEQIFEQFSLRWRLLVRVRYSPLHEKMETEAKCG